MILMSWIKFKCEFPTIAKAKNFNFHEKDLASNENLWDLYNRVGEATCKQYISLENNHDVKSHEKQTFMYDKVSHGKLPL